jgi:hypothetical protein
MADFMCRSSGRGVVALVVAVLLAGVSLEAAAVGDKGTIYFETGKLLTNFSFSYVPGSDSSPGILPAEQRLKFKGKGCIVELDPGYPELVTLHPLRGGSPGSLGFVSTSLGVYDGPQGTACGRVSQAKGEALGLSLGAGLPDGNAFDYLKIDIEAKGDVVLRLDVTFDGTVESYYLTAGAGAVSDPEVPLERITDCGPLSDSGPDAGPGDNCSWEISALGTSFTITPTAGEFSFEGGGDFPDVTANRTVIHLTEADGILDCGQSATATADPDSANISCSLTRLDPQLGTCTPVNYVFRTSGNTCSFEADPEGQQLVANLFVSYDPEIAGGNTLNIDSTYTNWPAVALSRVAFASDPNAADYPIPPCLGATISDGFSGPAPIPEIADGTSTDWVGGNDTIEFACVFQRTEVLETDPGSGLKRYIEEGLQFWGDIAFSRN